MDLTSRLGHEGLYSSIENQSPWLAQLNHNITGVSLQTHVYTSHQAINQMPGEMYWQHTVILSL